ncbi:MAG: hypothetical protein Kapaf2KO_23990 [Candidatus Kapaibacteriales bacterium]
MKKLIIFAVIIAATLVSCDRLTGPQDSDSSYRTQNLTSVPTYSVPNPNEYVGEYHNAIVNYYKRDKQLDVADRFHYASSVSYITDSCFNNIMESIDEYLVDTIGYTQLEVTNARNDVEDFFDDFSHVVVLSGQTYYKIVKDYRGAIQYAHNNYSAYDTETYDALMDIYPATGFGVSTSVETFISDLEDTLVSNSWSNTDLAKYIATYRYSECFWEYPVSEPDVPQDPIPFGMNPNQALAAADAAGAAMGLSLSPLGSIIAGAAMTMAEAEDQENGMSILVGSEYPESIWYD